MGPDFPTPNLLTSILPLWAQKEARARKIKSPPKTDRSFPFSDPDSDSESRAHALSDLVPPAPAMLVPQNELLDSYSLGWN